MVVGVASQIFAVGHIFGPEEKEKKGEERDRSVTVRFLVRTFPC